MQDAAAELDDAAHQPASASRTRADVRFPSARPPDAAAYLKWVNCVRANGVPDYPYPTGDTTNFQGSGVDPGSPAVMQAGKTCGGKLGLPAWWVLPATGAGALLITLLTVSWQAIKAALANPVKALRDN